MSNGIQYFMWGYQRDYRVHVSVAAEFALRKLDARLDPQVFLVGILDVPRSDRYPACVEPEHEHWIESEAFNDAGNLADTLRANYPEAQVHQSHPLAQQRQDAFLHRRSIRDAILEIV